MKKILIVILFLLFTSFSFADTTFLQKANSSFLDTFQGLVNFFYLILYPLMFLGKQLLSNNLVFGVPFGIDKPLWELWQVVRNFANYFIGFVFIISIFVYFFKSDSNLSWKKIFPKIAIAAVLLNMSWFLLGVMLDISSVLIAAFGGLSLQLSSTIDKVFHKNSDFEIPRVVVNLSGNKNDFFSVNIKGKAYYRCVFPIKTGDDTSKIDYSKPLNKPCLVLNGTGIKLYNKGSATITTGDTSKAFVKVSPNNLGIFAPFFRYLYTSFYQSNIISENGQIALAVVKLILLAVLIIPFVVLIIILFIRIVVLWVVIPFSPLILATYILGLMPGEFKSKFKDIISLIFQPVYVIITLVIGTAILNAVAAIFPDPHSNEGKTKEEIKKLLNVSDVKGQKNAIEVNGMMVVIGPEKSRAGTGAISINDVLSFFSWIFANLLAAFLLWTLVFTALKSNKFSEKIASSVDTYVTQSVKATPFIPVAGGQSISSLQQAWSQIQIYPEQKASQQTVELTKEIDKFLKKDDKKNNQ